MKRTPTSSINEANRPPQAELPNEGWGNLRQFSQASEADKFIAFWHAQAEWSQATFGTDKERGPTGPLKHLAKEVQEVLADPTDLIEFADLLFLVFDSTRRAGFTPEQLIDAANRKLAINKLREWPKPTSDEPVEHVREAAPPPAEPMGVELVGAEAKRKLTAVLGLCDSTAAWDTIIGNVEGQLSRLREQLAAAERERDEQKFRVDRQFEINNELRADLAAAEERIDGLKSRLDERTEQVHCLRIRAEDAEQRAAAAEAKLSAQAGEGSE